MAVYVNPETGNREVYIKNPPPQGYLTEEEWAITQPKPIPSQEEINMRRVMEIHNRLYQIDQKSLRPLRAIAEKADTDEDHEILAELNNEAENLRVELRSLTCVV